MKKKIWIDCDPGIDDMLALTYALKSDELDVLGISVVSGNVNKDKGYENVIRLLEFLDIQDIPVCKGKTSEDYIPAEDTHGANGIGNYYMPLTKTIKLTPFSTLESTINKNPSEVTLVCLGPLTNLAYILDDTIINNLKEVIIMGGCYKYPGNCSPVTEYNFWCDPKSAKQVFEAFQYCNKLKVIGLEITNHFVLTQEYIRAILSANKTIGEFVSGITRYYMDFHKAQEGLDGCVINDPVIIGYLLNPDTIKFSNYYVTICDKVDDLAVRGQMLVDRKKF